MTIRTRPIGDGPAVSLRKKLADSEILLNAVAWCIASYIRLVHATSRWERIGYEPLEALSAKGEPVIVALWHQRLALTPYYYPAELGPSCSVTSAARAGSMVGRVQTFFGMGTVPMESRQRHVALSRKVLQLLKGGTTIGFAADGPRGPARVATAVPLAWARVSGKKIFVITYSVKHATKTGWWDKMMLPRPFTRGVILCREWNETVPRKASEDDMERLRLSLQTLMNDLTAEADRMVGRTPEDLSHL